jgi:hypothetical protein
VYSRLKNSSAKTIGLGTLSIKKVGAAKKQGYAIASKKVTVTSTSSADATDALKGRPLGVGSYAHRLLSRTILLGHQHHPFLKAPSPPMLRRSEATRTRTALSMLLTLMMMVTQSLMQPTRIRPRLKFLQMMEQRTAVQFDGTSSRTTKPQLETMQTPSMRMHQVHVRQRERRLHPQSQTR